MKKRLFALIIFTIFIFTGCISLKQGESLNEERISRELKSDKSLNELVKMYNKKYNKNLDASKIEVYSVKQYKKGYLVLVSYKKEVLELKLFYIEKFNEKSYTVKEADGQYLPKISVNSLKDGDNTIFFGNVSEDYTNVNKDENSKGIQGKLSLTLDTGVHVEEKFRPSDKGYIIVVNSQGMVVDLIFTNTNSEPFNFIKEFVNYSHGVYDTDWDKK